MIVSTLQRAQLKKSGTTVRKKKTRMIPNSRHITVILWSRIKQKR